MKKWIFLLLGWIPIIFTYSTCLATTKGTVQPSSAKEQDYRRVTDKEIQKIIEKYISKNMSAELGNIKIKNFRIYPAKEVILPPGKLSWEVFAKRRSKLLGPAYFDILFNIDGRFEKKIRAIAYLESMQEVVITRRPLGRRQLISPDDIVMKEMNLAELPNNVILDSNQAIGKRTKAIIDPYTPLTTNILELPPLVKRRRLVRIVAETDVLRITTLGEARQDGRKGEVIKVRNISSKKEIYGRVIDANTVKIEIY